MPLELLKKKSAGDDSLLYDDEANKLITAINALLRLTVRPEIFGKFVFEEGGSKLDLTALQNYLDDFTPSHAFQLVLLETRIRVRSGSVNNILPDGMTSGDAEDDWFTLPIRPDGGIIYLEVLWDEASESVTGATVEQGDTVPEDNPTDGKFYKRIGDYSVDGGEVSIAQTGVSGPQAFDLCGGSQALWGLT